MTQSEWENFFLNDHSRLQDFSHLSCELGDFPPLGYSTAQPPCRRIGRQPVVSRLVCLSAYRSVSFRFWSFSSSDGSG